MFTHPGLTSQLAREHHRQMLAEASRRQPPRRHRHQAARHASGAGKIIRRVAAAIAGAGIAALPASTTEHHLGRWRQRSQPQASRPAGRPAGLTQQRHSPGGRWTSRGAAHVVRGHERDAR
jgi:hypothetical protein